MQFATLRTIADVDDAVNAVSTGQDEAGQLGAISFNHGTLETTS